MTFFAAGIAAAGLVGGALISSNASKSAAKTQAQSEAAATAAQQTALDKQIALQQPWLQTGSAGLGKLNSLLGLTPGQASGSPQLLTPGADGVFAPHAEIPQAQGFNEQAYLAANPDVADYIASHPPGSVGYTDAATHYQLFGQKEGRSLGLPAPQAVAAPAPGAPPVANNFSTPGSLTQSFGAADFTADAAPKIAPFVAPNAIPTFDPSTVMQNDPGYDFRLAQGEKGLTRAAAAQGGFGSGKYLKDLTTFNQDYASGEYGNAFNRFQVDRTNAVNDNKDAMSVYSLNRNNSLQDFSSAYDRFRQNKQDVLNPLLTISGFGQTAANATSGATQNFGNQAAAAITGAGNARAAGQVGTANAINGAIGQGVSMYGQQNALNRYYGSMPFYDTGAGITPPNPFYRPGA